MDTPYKRESFLKLIQANRGIIFKICHMYCHNVNDREDLAQEIIYQLWKSGNQFDETYKFSTWMYRVALNTAISFYRNEKKTVPTVPFHEEYHEVADRSGNHDLEQRLDQLQKMIRELKELDRALILLYLESRPQKEIADIMGITESNVSTRIGRIKEKIKNNFAQLNR